MKIVNFEKNKLKIKFKAPRDEFNELLVFVRKLEGRSYNSNIHIWEALPTKNNIELLKYNEFDFIDEAKELLKEKTKETEVEIIVENHRVKIYTDLDLLLELYKEFKYDDYRYCFTRSGFDASAIRTKHYFKIKDDYGECKIGFIQEIINYLDKYKIITNDNRLKIGGIAYETIKNNLTYLTLDNYQVEAFIACYESINGIVKLPPGSGKTEIFLSLCNLLDIRTLILFSRIDLARQTLARAKKAGLDAGIVQGTEIDENHKIIMCTVQSAHKLKDKYEMVICDECHNSSAKGYQKILRRKDFVYRFGFSATPFINNSNSNHKNIAVKQYLGDILFEKKVNDSELKHRLAQPKIKFIDINKPITIHKDKWPEIEYSGIVENNYRNSKSIELAYKYKCVLILIKKIRQGIILKEYIENSVFLYGGTDVKIREQAVKDFEAGKDIVLIASTIFDEGISINEIRNLIIAGGGASPIKAIQRLGRSLRITDIKKTVNVYDFMDKTNNILERHSKRRLKCYKEEGFEQIEFA